VLRAETDTGDVPLELLAAPQSVEVSTADGEVDLAVPVNTPYRTDASTDSGEVSVLVPVDPASARALRIDSHTGDVTVRASR
jgi:hypothetical protein